MFLPKISIITVSFNSEHTIEETIKSVTSQNYPNLEYLIIDGGSKDNTLQIVDNYRDKIDFLISEPDNGISDAFNKGIKYATGEIIGIINSDDLLLPNALETIAKHYNPDIDVYRGDLIVWNDLTGKKMLAISSEEHSLSIFKKRSVCHPSTFITKRAYNKYGNYKVDFRYMMDDDLLARLYLNGCKFKHINIPLATFRLGGTTASNYKKKIKELECLYIENGCSKIHAKIRVFMFSLYYILLDIVKKIIPMDTLRKIKYNKL